MGADSSPAKRQLQPVTCSRALAVDGADIEGPSEAVSILCLKGLTPGHEGVFSHPLALPSRDGQRMANPAKLLADARKLLAEWRLTTQAKADNNSRGLVLGGLATVNGRRGRHL